MSKEKNRLNKILHNFLLCFFMGVYFFILFVFLFLKKTSFQSVNLVPFQTIHNYLIGDKLARSFAVSNILGNIVLFLPLGIYIMLLNPVKKISIKVCYIALVSVIVEAIQYLCKVGVTDIDDVILNTFGGLIGVLICKILYKILKEKTRIAIEILAPIAGVCAIVILVLINR